MRILYAYDIVLIALIKRLQTLLDELHMFALYELLVDLRIQQALCTFQNLLRDLMC